MSLGHVLELAGNALDAAVHNSGEGLGVLASGAVVAFGHTRSRLELALGAAYAVFGILNRAIAVGTSDASSAGRIAGIGVVALGAVCTRFRASAGVFASATGRAAVAVLRVGSAGRASATLASARVGDVAGRAGEALGRFFLGSELAHRAKLACLVSGVVLECANGADVAVTGGALGATDTFTANRTVTTGEALGIPLLGFGLVFIRSAV